MTPHTSSDGAYESADVTGLAVGRYFADWLLTDVNGDSNACESLFAVKPAAAGTPGAAQPK